MSTHTYTIHCALKVWRQDSSWLWTCDFWPPTLFVSMVTWAGCCRVTAGASAARERAGRAERRDRETGTSDGVTSGRHHAGGVCVSWSVYTAVCVLLSHSLCRVCWTVCTVVCVCNTLSLFVCVECVGQRVRRCGSACCWSAVQCGAAAAVWARTERTAGPAGARQTETHTHHTTGAAHHGTATHTPQHTHGDATNVRDGWMDDYCIIYTCNPVRQTDRQTGLKSIYDKWQQKQETLTI